MSDITEKAIEYAKRFADAAPVQFKEVAFQTALTHFLETNGVKTDAKLKDVKKKPIISKSVQQDYLIELLESDYDWSSTTIRNLSPLGQYLKILKIAKTEFQIGTLSSEDIRKILNDKFRINKTVNTIGMSLMESVGKYVDRIKRGSEFHYRITLGGEQRLQKLEQKLGVEHG